MGSHVDPDRCERACPNTTYGRLVSVILVVNRAQQSLAATKIKSDWLDLGCTYVRFNTVTGIQVFVDLGLMDESY